MNLFDDKIFFLFAYYLRVVISKCDIEKVHVLLRYLISNHFKCEYLTYIPLIGILLNLINQ